MKKRLKKRERGKIAAILFTVVEVLFVFAILVVNNLKASANNPESASNRPYIRVKKTACINRVKLSVSYSAYSQAKTFMPVSYPGLFTFYYA